MAIGLANFPNVLPRDSDYPDGRIKDNPGDGTGTPVNQFTNGDIQEFFAKLLRLSGAAPSGLPENEYTGHQYIDALTALLDSEWIQSTDASVVHVTTPSGLTVTTFKSNYKQTYRDVIFQFTIIMSYSGSPGAPIVLIDLPIAAKQIGGFGLAIGQGLFDGTVSQEYFQLRITNTFTESTQIIIQSSNFIPTDAGITMSGEIRYEKATLGHS